MHMHRILQQYAFFFILTENQKYVESQIVSDAVYILFCVFLLFFLLFQVCQSSNEAI